MNVTIASMMAVSGIGPQGDVDVEVVAPRVGIIDQSPGPEIDDRLLADGRGMLARMLGSTGGERLLRDAVDQQQAGHEGQHAGEQGGQWLCSLSTRLPKSAVISVAASGSAGIRMHQGGRDQTWLR